MNTIYDLCGLGEYVSMSSFRRSKTWVFLGFHAGTWYFVLRKFPPLKRHCTKRNGICQPSCFPKSNFDGYFLPRFRNEKSAASKETAKPALEGWAGRLCHKTVRFTKELRSENILTIFSHTYLYGLFAYSAPFVCRFTYLYTYMSVL